MRVYITKKTSELYRNFLPKLQLNHQIPAEDKMSLMQARKQRKLQIEI